MKLHYKISILLSAFGLLSLVIAVTSREVYFNGLSTAYFVSAMLTSLVGDVLSN